MIVFISSNNQLDGVYLLNSHKEYEDQSKPTAEDGFVRVFLAITSPYLYGKTITIEFSMVWVYHNILPILEGNRVSKNVPSTQKMMFSKCQL